MSCVVHHLIRVPCLQTYSQTVTISNNLGATVDASIRCGSSDRYNVVPTSFSLKPGQSCNVEVCLRVLKYAQKRKAVEQGQRDVFHIKARPADDFPLSSLGYLSSAWKPFPLQI